MAPRGNPTLVTVRRPSVCKGGHYTQCQELSLNGGPQTGTRLHGAEVGGRGSLSRNHSTGMGAEGREGLGRLAWHI